MSNNEMPKLNFNDAQNEDLEMQEKIKSGEVNDYHGAEKLIDNEEVKISELGKKVIEGAKKYSDKEIANWNEGAKESITEFIDRSLLRIKESLSIEEFNQFNEALAKYPLIDLASGSPHLPGADILTILFKKNTVNWLPHIV